MKFVIANRTPEGKVNSFLYEVLEKQYTFPAVPLGKLISRHLEDYLTAPVLESLGVLFESEVNFDFVETMIQVGTHINVTPKLSFAWVTKTGSQPNELALKEMNEGCRKAFSTPTVEITRTEEDRTFVYALTEKSEEMVRRVHSLFWTTCPVRVPKFIGRPLDEIEKEVVLLLTGLDSEDPEVKSAKIIHDGGSRR